MTARAQHNITIRSLGIRADGRDIGLRFHALDDAMTNAHRLAERGYDPVIVFDQSTGQTVRTFRKPAWVFAR